MKWLLSKIGSSFLILLVLFGTFGFTISSHLCGGEVVITALSFVKKDLKCGMQKSPQNCPKHSSSNSNLKDICCQNVFDYQHLNNDLQQGKLVVKTTKNVVVAPVSTDQILALIKNNEVFSNTHYNPPNRVENIVLVNNSFII